MERLFRRAELPLGMSQGFHPKPRMSFPAALAVGIEGLDEVMEIELAQPLTAETLLQRLTECTVPGLDFRSAELLPPGIKANKARVTHVTYEIEVPVDRQHDVAEKVARLVSQTSLPIHRPDRSKPIDLLEFLETLKWCEGTLFMTFRVTQQANPGPRDVLDVLDLADLETRGSRLRRTEVRVAK